MKNCIVKTSIDDTPYFWHGGGWATDREKARRYSLPEVEKIIENMREDDVMAWWERYDGKRSSL